MPTCQQRLAFLGENARLLSEQMHSPKSFFISLRGTSKKGVDHACFWLIIYLKTMQSRKKKKEDKSSISKSTQGKRELKQETQ